MLQPQSKKAFPVSWDAFHRTPGQKGTVRGYAHTGPRGLRGGNAPSQRRLRAYSCAPPRLKLIFDDKATQNDLQAGIRLWNNSRAHASARSGAHERNAKTMAESAPVRRGRVPNSTLLIQSWQRTTVSLSGVCDRTPL
jgi:hypothetical protein